MLWKTKIALIAAAISLPISFIFTLTSMYWTIDTAFSYDELSRLEFGWPLPFAIQNQRDLDISPMLPIKMSFVFGLGGGKTVISKAKFSLSFLINAIIIFFIIIMVYIGKRKFDLLYG